MVSDSSTRVIQVWNKIRKDGGPDGRGICFYFRNVTELVLFGIRGENARTITPGRSQANFIATQKREHPASRMNSTRLPRLAVQVLTSRYLRGVLV